MVETSNLRYFERNDEVDDLNPRRSVRSLFEYIEQKTTASYCQTSCNEIVSKVIIGIRGG